MWFFIFDATIPFVLLILIIGSILFAIDTMWSTIKIIFWIFLGIIIVVDFINIRTEKKGDARLTSEFIHMIGFLLMWKLQSSQLGAVDRYKEAGDGFSFFLEAFFGGCAMLAIEYGIYRLMNMITDNIRNDITDDAIVNDEKNFKDISEYERVGSEVFISDYELIQKIKRGEIMFGDDPTSRESRE